MESIIIWSAIIIISLVTEGMTAALVAIWFVPGAAVSLVLSLLGVKSIAIQAAVFVVISAGCAFLLRDKIRKSINQNHEKTNLDALIGKTARVVCDIPADGEGRVAVGDVTWIAYTDSGIDISMGEKVKILDISGVKLLCAPVEQKAQIKG